MRKYITILIVALACGCQKDNDEPTFCWECATYWEITNDDNSVAKDTVDWQECNRTEGWAKDWETRNTGTTAPYWVASGGDTTWYKSATTVTNCNRK